VKTSRFGNPRAKPSPAVVKSPGFGSSWSRFWFTPADPIGLHMLRILAGMLFLAWLVPLAGEVDSLFGQRGWFDYQTYAEAARLQADFPEIGDNTPLPFGWSVLFWLGDNQLAIFYWLAILIVVLFTLGIFTRPTSILTWVALVSCTANPVLESDGDVLVRLLAMYLMVGYVLLDQLEPGQSVWSRFLGSRDTLLLGRSPARPSMAANVALRLLQIHLVIVVVTSALHKLQFGEWWAGFALWYPVHSQASLDDIHRLAQNGNFHLGIYSLATYLVLGWQFAFPFFAWRPRWRPLLLGGAALAWLANAWLYEVPIFGPAFAVCCLSFVTPAEWRRLLIRVGRLTGVADLTRLLPADYDDLVERRSKENKDAEFIAAGRR